MRRISTMDKDDKQPRKTVLTRGKTPKIPPIQSKQNHNRPKGIGHPGVDPKSTWLSTRWQGDDEQSFWNWVEDIQPRILHKGRYEEWQPTDGQREMVKAAFSKDPRYFILLDIEPRRMGKSTVWALIVLFYFTSKRNVSIGLLGTQDEHTHRTMFKRLEMIIRNTLELRKRVDPDKNFLTDYARLQDPKQTTSWQNRIVKLSGTMAGSFGDVLDLIWVSDAHQFLDFGPFRALQASLWDSARGQILVDANVDYEGGPLHEMEIAALADPGIWCRHVSFKDYDEWAEKAPPWISRDKVKSSQKMSLEVDFKRDVLGQRSGAVNRLFPDITIQACRDHYRMPVDDPEALARGRKFVCGGGLDRAKNLIAGPSGDHTVWTSIMKVAALTGEPEYYILNQHKFTLNTSKAIKDIVLKDHKRYHFTNTVLEAYEVADLQSWFASQDIPCSLQAAGDTVQNASFPELHRIFADGRMHLPENSHDLQFELSNFIYQQRKTASGGYSFGHISQKFHDDHVYSLNWAVWALRDQVLDLFSLSHIDCKQHSTTKRGICFLMGGSVVPYCAQDCSAFYEVCKMHQEFKAYHSLDSELTIQEFYKSFVRSTDGVIQYQVL